MLGFGLDNLEKKKDASFVVSNPNSSYWYVARYPKFRVSPAILFISTTINKTIVGYLQYYDFINSICCFFSLSSFTNTFPFGSILRSKRACAQFFAVAGFGMILKDLQIVDLLAAE